MNKIIAILCLFLFACAGEEAQTHEMSDGEMMSGESHTAGDTQTVRAQTDTAAVEQKSSSVFDLANSLTQGLPVRCVSEKDGMTATLYFKGKNVRMDTSPVDAHGIYTEEWMYSWSGDMGSKMRMADLVKLGGQAQQAKSHEELVSEAQNPDVDCTPASVSDDLFVPPSNVTFQDLGALLSDVGMAIPRQ